jgi:hypothetical protein
VARPRIELVTKASKQESGSGRLERVPPESSDQSLRISDAGAQHLSCLKGPSAAAEKLNALEHWIIMRGHLFWTSLCGYAAAPTEHMIA